MDTQILIDNGWRLDHEKWVCPNHPTKPCVVVEGVCTRHLPGRPGCVSSPDSSGRGIHPTHKMSSFSDVPWGCKNCGLCECHAPISLTDECPGFVKYPTGEHKLREIPVTLNFDMTKPIGTAKVFEDKHGIRVEMKIHDTGAQAILRGEDLRHLSINTAHLVRDKDKERKLPWQQK